MSAVKLFGKTIHLQSNDVVSVAVDCDQNRSSELLDDKENAAMASKPNNGSSSTIMDSTSENPQTTSKDKEQSETSSSQEENPSKKPDKIIPCPRCKSIDTKFCYFNNYNLNQPRHFCKNCQRYWTAGGSMRNVPVGSGRRKAKNSPHCLPNEFIKPESEHCVPNGSSPQLSQLSCFPAPPWYPAQWKPVFWGYGVPGSCNTQWPCVSASSSHISPLGKHSREEDNNGTKTRVLTPKTLRIDDPSEAAKSSIWATIGMRNEEANSMNSRGVFGGFQSKDIGEMNSFADGSLVLHANPAAFSRSLRFHERAE